MPHPFQGGLQGQGDSGPSMETLTATTAPPGHPDRSMHLEDKRILNVYSLKNQSLKILEAKFDRAEKINRQTHSLYISCGFQHLLPPEIDITNTQKFKKDIE